MQCLNPVYTRLAEGPLYLARDREIAIIGPPQASQSDAQISGRLNRESLGRLYTVRKSQWGVRQRVVCLSLSCNAWMSFMSRSFSF